MKEQSNKDNALEVMTQRNVLAERSSAAHYAIYDASRALGATPPASGPYVKERKNLDLALLFLSKAKWYAGRYTGTHLYVTEHTQDPTDANHAELYFDRALEVAKSVEKALDAKDGYRGNHVADRYRNEIKLQVKDGEITYADDVPIVPAICPLIILQGSSYDMGRQYVQQVVEIFGAWVFERIASRKFETKDIDTIKKWHEQMDALTPEIGQMVKGWVDEAAKFNIDLNYWNAIQLWTGHFSPIWEGIRGHGVRDLAGEDSDEDKEAADASYLGGQSMSNMGVESTVDLCSGACAWGEATRDGSLIVGATTDHDCTFQATIVAFPDTGNSFVYTPFSVTGFIPGLGQYYFAGHPGMNNKGLAYVHHGGGLHGIEGQEDRGYGLRRGASVFHNLRFSDSAKDAFSKEMTWPIGDVGTILGSVGGFYADANYAYICEARPSISAGSAPIVREFSYDEVGRCYAFLYANNNSVHPRSHRGFAPPPQGYDFNAVEGSVCDKPSALAHLGEKQLAPALSTKSSQGRNRYLFNSLKASYGKIDIDSMLKTYSTSAPERYDENGERLTHREREIAWTTGKSWPSSICHRVNAFTAVLRPDDGDDGIYMGCIGPANRHALMHIPGHGYYYYDEANEFWEIRLRRSPGEVLAEASKEAKSLLDRSDVALSSARVDPEVAQHFSELTTLARNNLLEGMKLLAETQEIETEAEKTARLSRALRRFTISQVRSKQVKSELDRFANSRPHLVN